MSAVGLFSQHHHVIHPRQLIISFPTSSVTTINLMFCKSEADFATTLLGENVAKFLVGWYFFSHFSFVWMIF
jgi:hypothetical protein